MVLNRQLMICTVAAVLTAGTALSAPRDILANNSEGGPTPGGATAAGAASSVASVATTEPVRVPGTPSGEGDPDTIVCRAPQRMADSGQFGPEACGHNYEWQRLAMNGKDLAPDGKTLIDRPTVADPNGEGDPDAVTCRTPRFVIRGPLIEVCRTNRFW